MIGTRCSLALSFLVLAVVPVAAPVCVCGVASVASQQSARTHLRRAEAEIDPDVSSVWHAGLDSEWRLVRLAGRVFFVSARGLCARCEDASVIPIIRGLPFDPDSRKYRRHTPGSVDIDKEEPRIEGWSFAFSLFLSFRFVFCRLVFPFCVLVSSRVFRKYSHAARAHATTLRRLCTDGASRVANATPVSSWLVSLQPPCTHLPGTS